MTLEQISVHHLCKRSVIWIKTKAIKELSTVRLKMLSYQVDQQLFGRNVFLAWSACPAGVFPASAMDASYVHSIGHVRPERPSQHFHAWPPMGYTEIDRKTPSEELAVYWWGFEALLLHFEALLHLVHFEDFRCREWIVSPDWPLTCRLRLRHVLR
jgi:hypothetical protein